MKNYILLLLLCILSITSYSQKVPSSCNASDSVRALYRTDAQRIALSRIYKYNSPYKDSVTIPEIWTDTIMRALLAVHNASLLPASDTVKTLHIHSQADQDSNAASLNELSLYVDYSKLWVKELEVNTFPTSDTSVNNLIVKYPFLKLVHLKKPPYSQAFMTWRCDSNLNLKLIAKEWQTISGVLSIKNQDMFGSGNNYLWADSVSDKSLFVNYSYGWMDCPSGCQCWRWWYFKVDFLSCDVEFLFSGGGGLPQQYCILPYPNSIEKVHSELITVYPNPFNDYIQISKPEVCLSYRLIDMTGRLIKQGQADKTGKIYTQELLTGLYILLLLTDTQSYSIHIIKE